MSSVLRMSNNRLTKMLNGCLAFVITYVIFYAGITSIELNQIVFLFGWLNVGILVYKGLNKLQGINESARKE